jgi:hypothetical protein
MEDRKSFLPKKIEMRELYFLLLFSIGILLIVNIPYLLGVLNSNEHLTFTGAIFAIEDTLSYFAKMNQGASGQWTYTLAFSSEPHVGKPIFIYYLFLGHLANIFKLSIPITYHLSRLINGLIFLFSLYFFLKLQIKSKRETFFIFTLCSFSSGIGWILALFGNYLSSDLTIPESNTFMTLFHAPHMILSQALILILWILFLSNPVNPHHKGLILPGIILTETLLSLIQPFINFNVFGTTGLYMLLQWIETKSFPRPLFKKLSAAIIAAIFPTLLTLISIQSSSILKIWSNQNICRSPSPIYYITGYGILLILALPQFKQMSANSTSWHKFILSWLPITIIGIYFPIDLQRRLSMGLHLPIAIAAGLCICRIATQIKWKEKTFVKPLYLFLTLPTTCFMLILLSSGVYSQNEKIFISSAEKQSFQWLNIEADKGQIVFTDPEIGIKIPAFTQLRSFAGHGFETINLSEKEVILEKFFSHQLPIDETCLFFQDNPDIKYIVQDTTIYPDPVQDICEIQFEVNFGNLSIYTIKK